jgi:DNA-directed RNA polymerase subunit beta'
MNFELLELKKKLKQYNSLTNSFDYISLSLASPKKIQNWCQNLLSSGEILGEVLNAETVNFRTKIPVSDGIFCQKIFGPINDWKCKCGKYRGLLTSKICEICKVQLTEARVRRYKMGYISLPTPICHYWYFGGNPAYLCVLLKLEEPNFKNKEIKDLIYFYETSKIFSSFSRKHTIRTKKKLNSNILNSNELDKEILGSELILKFLENLSNNIEEKIEFLRNLTLKKKTNIKILRILESFFATKTKLEWMLFTVLPVLPPALRPFVEVENHKIVSSDLNEFYRVIIYRIQRYKLLINKYNSSIKGFFTDSTSKTLAYHDKRLIQLGIDALIDNARLPKDSIFTSNNRSLKGLTELLEGKYGRFRLTLLGKRVDYSGRSVIVVEPDLQLNEFGLPYSMAIEIFKPFLINLLSKTKIKKFIEKPKLLLKIIDTNKIFIWKILEKLVENNAFLLNRAPTLHKFGIQAFLPILIPTKAIQLHPLVCTGFNADFDGDQMAIHLPLYETTQLEAKGFMRPSFNIFSPSNGESIIKPSQDIVIGCYYLSLFLSHRINLNNFWFSNETDIIGALYQKKISLHTPIFCRYFLQDFKIKIKFKKLFIYFSNVLLEEIKIIKTFKSNNKHILLLTNIGIFCAKKNNFGSYEINSFFLQTTPGRVIFSGVLKSVF